MIVPRKLSFKNSLKSKITLKKNSIYLSKSLHLNLQIINTKFKIYIISIVIVRIIISYCHIIIKMHRLI